MPDKMLWNVGRTESVKASKIRTIGIYPETIRQTPEAREGSRVLGWYNANEYFYFGWFETEGEARAFMEQLHQQIES